MIRSTIFCTAKLSSCRLILGLFKAIFLAKSSRQFSRVFRSSLSTSLVPFLFLFCLTRRAFCYTCFKLPILVLYVGGFFNTNSYLRILALLIFSVGRFLAFAKKSTTLLFRQKEAVGFFYRKTALLRICFSKFSIRNCFLNDPYDPKKKKTAT